MSTYRGVIYILFMVVSLLFFALDHRGNVFGDMVFRFFGISPWSDKVRNQGLHIPVICGFLLIIISGRLSIRYFRARYAKAGRIVVISCILFFLIFPLITEGAMQVFNYNKSGVATIDFSKKNSKCNFKTENNIVLFECNLTLINYSSRSEEVKIHPLFNDKHGMGSLSSIDLNYEDILLPPRSKRSYNIHFISSPDNNNSTSGMTLVSGIQLMKSGQEKTIYWE